MELNDGDILFAGGLLGFYESGRVVDAGDEAAGNFGVQGARMTSLFDFEDLFNPSDDLVGGRVRRLIKIDDTIVLEHVDGALSGRISARKWRKVGGLDVQLVEILASRVINNHIERLTEINQRERERAQK